MGGQGGCERKSALKIFFGGFGSGGRGRRVGGGGQGGFERRSEVFVKIQKKKNIYIFFLGGGGGWAGGSDQGLGWGGGSKVWGRWVIWGMDAYQE